MWSSPPVLIACGCYDVGGYRLIVLVFVAVAVFDPDWVIVPVLAATAVPPVAVFPGQRFTLAATASVVPVAVGFPVLVQLAVAFPPTAAMLTVLLLDWRITLDWRTLVTRA